MFDTEDFFDLINPNKNIIVAFSGGGDSSALLHYCHDLRQKKVLTGSLSAIHVNHSLSKNANLWEKHCQDFCKDKNILINCVTINVNSKSSGIESAARNKRYKIFQDILKENDQLLTAHHADDVAETILYRLFRGTGIDGLQGPMKKRYLGKGVLLRPWLGYTKSELILYLTKNKIKYIDDETNFVGDQDRNFIRNELLTLVSSRWLKASTQIKHTADIISRHKEVHDLLIYQQYSSYMQGLKIQREFLTNLDKDLCSEVIRYWIKQNNLAMPNKKILEEIYKAFIYSNPSAKTKVNWSRADKDQKGASLSFKDGDLILNKK
ncbi:MAG: tRNA lysidine(34) synthetase TilS [Gammaproteobacteria bacterium]|nr:tRNA lysidine(34) synthetase TilS [Gammaproteobacteria bacterium]